MLSYVLALMLDFVWAMNIKCTTIFLYCCYREIAFTSHFLSNRCRQPYFKRQKRFDTCMEFDKIPNWRKFLSISRLYHTSLGKGT